MSTDDRDAEKAAAAEAAVADIRDGMLVGLGSGSTAACAVRAVGRRVAEGLRVECVATSRATEALARSVGLTVRPFEDIARLDLTIDGADEIDPALRAIKGGGGALLREKIVASATKKFVIIADSSKQVPMLGKFPVPVEVIKFAEALVAKKIAAMGAEVKVRADASGRKFITDEGNHILDCHFGQIPDPPALARKLETTPGVVEHGLFIGMASIALIGKGTQVLEIPRKDS
jgi:ribose 5-phosphate isomerase A